MSVGSARVGGRRRAAARLAAVQALYDAEMSGASVDSVIRDFTEHRVGGVALLDHPDGGAEVEKRLADADAILFASLVRAAAVRQDEIDAMIDAALTGEWSTDRLEAVLRATLRAAVGELLEHPDVPPKVTIAEFVEVARAFYAGSEPGLVNAVLDRIARALRPEAFEDGEHTR